MIEKGFCFGAREHSGTRNVVVTDAREGHVVLVPVGEGVQCYRARVVPVDRVERAISDRGAVVKEAVSPEDVDAMIHVLLSASETPQAVLDFLLPF